MKVSSSGGIAALLICQASINRTHKEATVCVRGENNERGKMAGIPGADCAKTIKIRTTMLLHVSVTHFHPWGGKAIVMATKLTGPVHFLFVLLALRITLVGRVCLCMTCLLSSCRLFYTASSILIDHPSLRPGGRGWQIFSFGFFEDTITCSTSTSIPCRS